LIINLDFFLKKIFFSFSFSFLFSYQNFSS